MKIEFQKSHRKGRVSKDGTLFSIEHARLFPLRPQMVTTGVVADIPLDKFFFFVLHEELARKGVSILNPVFFKNEEITEFKLILVNLTPPDNKNDLDIRQNFFPNLNATEIQQGTVLGRLILCKLENFEPVEKS